MRLLIQLQHHVSRESRPDLLAFCTSLRWGCTAVVAALSEGGSGVFLDVKRCHPHCDSFFTFDRSDFRATTESIWNRRTAWTCRESPAGVAMAAAFREELTADATSDWRYVFGFTILYFSLLAPSVSSIARVGDAATSSGRSVIPRVAIFQLPRNTSREDSVVWRSESDVYATGRSPVNLE